MIVTPTELYTTTVTNSNTLPLHKILLDKISSLETVPVEAHQDTAATGWHFLPTIGCEGKTLPTVEIEEVSCVNGPTMLYLIAPKNLAISSLLAKAKKAHENKRNG